MIRVNLLPDAGARRRAPDRGPRWVALVVAAVAIEIVVLFFIHQSKEDELSELSGKVDQLTNQVTEIQSLVKNHAQVKKDLEELRSRQDSMNQLNAARTGPTNVLVELSRILTKSKGPTIEKERLEQLRQENPLAVFNPAWDPRRVWLTGYVENQRTVTLDGLARDGGDVYEFAQRLKLSQFFEGVRLKEGVQDRTSVGGARLDLVKFSLEVKARY